MHIETAMVSTAVAGAYALTQAGALGYSLKPGKDDKPANALTTASAGAFVFSAQMVNFSIAGTGSSGHFTGGMFLAYLLGSKRSFLLMSLILTLQAFLFGDGGLMALGCNIFNMAFIPSFIIYPLLIKPFMKSDTSELKKMCMLALGCIASLVAGSLSVVMQAGLSGTAGLSLSQFVANMVPVHCAIGVVEGIVSVCIVQVINAVESRKKMSTRLNITNSGIALSVLAVVTSTIFSAFASANPDGLEWSLINTVGTRELVSTSPVAMAFDKIQSVTSIFADYTLFSSNSVVLTSVAGLVGCLVVFAIAFSVMKKKQQHSA